jgi:hypothetical protein
LQTGDTIALDYTAGKDVLDLQIKKAKTPKAKGDTAAE